MAAEGMAAWQKGGNVKRRKTAGLYAFFFIGKQDKRTLCSIPKIAKSINISYNKASMLL